MGACVLHGIVSHCMNQSTRPSSAFGCSVETSNSVIEREPTAVVQANDV